MSISPFNDDRISSDLGPLAQPGRKLTKSTGLLSQDKSSEPEDEETQWSRVRIPHGP